MKLPSDCILEIEKNKIVNYLLNPNHPDGKVKADFFSANGINSGNAVLLEVLLKQQALNNEITKKAATIYGLKYIFESVLKFPNNKNHLIRSVWISEENEKIIKFVTAYKIER